MSEAKDLVGRAGNLIREALAPLLKAGVVSGLDIRFLAEAPMEGNEHVVYPGRTILATSKGALAVITTHDFSDVDQPISADYHAYPRSDA